MKKFLRKKPMLLLCALLLFSLGCMGVLAVAEPKSTGAAAETEVMTEGAVPLADGMEDDGIELVTVATPSETIPAEVETKTISLNPNGGELGEVDEVLVNAETGKLLTDLPEPTREGWTFEGWYTEEGKETLITGEYSTTVGDPAPLGDDSKLEERLREELKEAGKDSAAVDKMTRKEVLAMLNHWLVLPKGEKVTDTVQGDTGCLYAVYKPISYTVAYHKNGWKGQTGVFYTSAEYGAPVSSFNLNHRDPWSGHTLEGWSREENGSVVMRELTEKGDTIYKIGESPLEIPESGTTIDLYAVGTTPLVTEVSVYLQKSDTRHGSDGWHMTLRYTLSPSSEQDTHVTWSVDRNDIATIDWDNKEKYQATLTIWDRHAINETTPVAVTVTSDNGVSGSYTVEVKHNWYETYSYKPNCQHTGSVTYRCDSCDRSWTKSLEKTPHKFSYTHTAATCTTDGYEERVCGDCGLKEITKIEPATGHTWTVQVVSGCGGAVRTRTCTVCGFTETDVDVNDAAHQWESVMTVDKEPTCSEAGSRSYHCAVCGLTKESEIIPANPDLHRWTGWTVVKKPQIGVMGEESRRCLTCKDVETRDIEALLPTVDSEAAKTPSQDDSAAPSDDAADDDKSESVPDSPSIDSSTDDNNDDVSSSSDDFSKDPGNNAGSTGSDSDNSTDSAAGDSGNSTDNTGSNSSSSTGSTPGSDTGSTSGTPSSNTGNTGGTPSSNTGNTGSTPSDNTGNTGSAPSSNTGNTTSSSGGGSSSGGSSSGGGGSRGGSGGGGGSSRSGSGSSAAKASAGPSAVVEATPLPIVPTAEIRAALPTYVEVGTWDKAADGSWTCKDENGEPYTNEWAAVYNPYANTAAADAYDWFRFDATGHLITGWYVDPVDGNTYYMNEASDGTQGRMMTGWVTIGGKEYYFNPNSDGQRGRMYRNEATPDGHFVGPDGAKIW